MEKKSSIFDQNYALLMERFPKLALEIPPTSFIPKSKEKMPAISLQEVEILYVYGLGQAEAYFQVKEWLLKNSSHRLIFLEDQLEEIAAFLYADDAARVLTMPQITLARLDTLDLLVEEFPSNAVEVISLPSKSKRRFRALKEKILQKTTLASGSHVDRLYGYQLFHNFVKNLQQLPRSFYANRLQGQFRGYPAVVCGAGPSLKQAIPILKTLENKALIVAGGSTLAALSSQGILPHFGMAVDPNLEEYRRLKNSFAFEVPLLYSTRVFPAIFQTANGPFGYMRSGVGGILELWMEEELGLKDPLIGINLSEESISVTTMCLAWAQFLGCSPILLSGIDLAYTEKRRYADGVIQEEEDFLETKGASDRIVIRKDRKGKKINTAVRWLIEANAFSHFASMHPETTFLNVTEGGIGFKKIPYRPLQEVVSEFRKEASLRSMIHEAICKASMPFHTQQVINEKIRSLFESLDRIISHLEVCVGTKTGMQALAEIELEEEMAYPYLFYDASSVLQKEIARSIPLEEREKEKWVRFLKLARSYQQVLYQSQKITS